MFTISTQRIKIVWRLGSGVQKQCLDSRATSSGLGFKFGVAGVRAWVLGLISRSWLHLKIKKQDQVSGGRDTSKVEGGREKSSNIDPTSTSVFPNTLTSKLIRNLKVFKR